MVSWQFFSVSLRALLLAIFTALPAETHFLLYARVSLPGETVTTRYLPVALIGGTPGSLLLSHAYIHSRLYDYVRLSLILTRYNLPKFPRRSYFEHRQPGHVPMTTASMLVLCCSLPNQVCATGVPRLHAGLSLVMAQAMARVEMALAVSYRCKHARRTSFFSFQQEVLRASSRLRAEEKSAGGPRSLSPLAGPVSPCSRGRGVAFVPKGRALTYTYILPLAFI